MIVVQTNNASFGDTDESEQQLAMSRLPAVEFGRTVAVVATSGISAVVAPDGTVALRLDAAPEWALTALGAGAVIVAVGLRLLARSRR